MLRDLDISGLAAAFATRTESGRAALLARLENPLIDPVAIATRQEEIRTIRKRLRDQSTAAAVADCRAKIAAAEADCLSVADAATDSRHAEYYNQILWPAGSWFAWLNCLGWLNELIVFVRTILLPGLSVLLPLLVFAGPLVLLIIRAGPGESITFGQYLAIIQGALKQAVPSVLGRPRFAGRGGIAEMGEQFVHIGASVAMFSASIWNQVSAARTMRGVAADMRRRAAAVRETAAAVAALGTALGVGAGADTSWPAEDLGLFGIAWNEPDRVRRLLATAGHLDMLAAIAGARRTCFPGRGSDLSLTDLYHPSIEVGARVTNSITMDDASSGRHILLTGPNRGGKSTLLRALGAAVLMAQTVGVVFARRARLPVFGAIITALAPADKLGAMSLFEAEIEFAKRVRERLEDGCSGTGPMFLMMDEIFHGTNAHDGVEASQVFLDELYGHAGVFSVVSTHYMELPRRYGDGAAQQAQTLCMEATVDPADTDRLVYSYRLCPGVNQYSSVREILRERGLLLAPRTGAAKTLEAPSKVC